MLEERQVQLKTGRIIPQTNEEYGYEDHYPHWAPAPPGDSAEVLCRCAWEIAMAGAYGTAGETARRGVNIWPDTGGGWLNGRGDDTMVMLKGYAAHGRFLHQLRLVEDRAARRTGQRRGVLPGEAGRNLRGLSAAAPA